MRGSHLQPMTLGPVQQNEASRAIARIELEDSLPEHRQGFCMVHSIRSTLHQVARHYPFLFGLRHCPHRATRFVPTRRSVSRRELVTHNCPHLSVRFRSETAFPGYSMPKTLDCS